MPKVVPEFPKKSASAITKDLQAEVVQQIVAALKDGILPWAEPLSGYVRPVNAARGNAYTGINFLILMGAQRQVGYEHGRWLTFTDIVKAKGHLRKGERAIKALAPWKGKPIPAKTGAVVTPEKASAEARADEKAMDGKTFTPMGYTSFALFNVAQVDDLPEDVVLGLPRQTPDEGLQLAKDLLVATGAIVKRTGLAGHYVPTSDILVSAPMESFDSEADAMVDTIHLLVHWSGHASRLDRDLSSRLGEFSDAGEELVAHLATAFLQADLGLTGTLRHTNYAPKWLEMLHTHPRVLFTCTRQAELAVTHLLSYLKTETVDGTDEADPSAMLKHAA